MRTETQTPGMGLLLARMARGMIKPGVAVIFYSAWLSFFPNARAELQFDVFPGYDNVVRDAGWFPIAFEIFNDGAPINGVVEISSGSMGSEQLQRIPIELPTNTRKRFSIPMFATGGRFFQWNTRLLDDRGKVRAERSTLQPRILDWRGVLIGALPRTFAGMPTLPDLRRNRPELKPAVARMTVDQFPDNPIALEGLDALYLNSERALELSVSHVEALLAWLYGGGHLMVSVEQLGDVNATAWLQRLLPANLKQMVNLTIDKELQQWLQTSSGSKSGNSIRAGAPGREARSMGSDPYMNLPVDPEIAKAQIPVATGTVVDGEILVSAGGKPLVLQAPRGRGQITLITFNPEREPFRSWKNRAWFWSKLVGIPGEWFLTDEIRGYGGWSIDGVFGALIDSRQVRKLPVQWLLLLLVVYLVVIGPFDQYILKRIGKQMLTWITFPAYVVLFSLLIYFIGYKLRAGETEWNELHVVDILPQSADRAALRGRTYASVYSSSNAKYSLGFTPASGDLADRTYASFRGELLDLTGGIKEGSRATIQHLGNTFRTEVFVPVWTSLLYVSDWLEPASAPLTASIERDTKNWRLTLENHLDRPLTDARIVIEGAIYDLGTLAAQERKGVPITVGKGIPLESFLQQNGGRFHDAVNQRRNPLGDNQRGWIDQPELHSMVASFVSQLPGQQNQQLCVAPAGLDLTPFLERGNAAILAWDAGHSFCNPINLFTPPRSQKNTLLRLVIPITSPATK